MKKTLLLAVSALLFVQCTSSVYEEPKSGVYTPDKSHNPYERTPDEAIKAVEELLQSSEFRSMNVDNRVVDCIVDLEQVSGLRASQQMVDFGRRFYAVDFKGDRGYAIVSKDLRTFPIFAVLDSGHADSKTLNSPNMLVQTEKMLAGFDQEVKAFNEDLEKEKDQLRGNNDRADLNTENAINNFVRDGWNINKVAPPRLESNWEQSVGKPYLVMNPEGASYHDMYERPNFAADDHAVYHVWGKKLYHGIVATPPKSFGCTPVAFGQVMYALRKEKGFRDLKYHSGEPVLWDQMGSDSNVKECQRFLGWITMNCSPTNFGDETMVFNIKATKFLRKTMGSHIHSRYDNCVVSSGDFDGYGWSEDKRVAEEFFKYPKCFVIMTASAGALDYISYHTFVVDGMVEFSKRMKGSGFLGTGLFRKKRNGIRHLYHVNAGWRGVSNGYYLYVQSVNDEYKYTGTNNAMDYRSKVAYVVVRPS